MDRKKLIDGDIIRRVFSEIVGDRWTEIRVIDGQIAGQRRSLTYSGYFRDAETAVRQLKRFDKWTSVCYLPNELDERCHSRTPNEFSCGKNLATSDRDIIRRCWLLIDIDVERPSGISASPEEVESAEAVADSIQLQLTAEGMPSPVRCVSGNGCHLMFRIDLPADDGGAVQRLLQQLSERFGVDGVKVDKTTFNAGRIWKLPGTLACKGGDTEERPHRMADITFIPQPLEVADLSILVEPTSDVEPKPVEARRSVTTYTATTGSCDIAGFIERHGLHVGEGDIWFTNSGPGKKWRLKESPLCDHHNDGPWIGEKGSGYGAAGCHHDSCSWTFADLQAKYEPAPPSPKSKLQAPKRIISSLEVSTMADLEEQDIDWLWQGRFAVGKLSIVSGVPGLGKSYATISMAARISQGQPFPDTPDIVNPVGDVLLIGAEDGWEDTVKPRLRLADADQSRVHVTTTVTRRGKENQWLNLESDLPLLDEWLTNYPDARLVTLDPVNAYLGQVDGNSDVGIRAVMTPLAALAEKHEVCVIAIVHCGKAEGRSSAQRVLGSTGYVGVARTLFEVLRAPDQPQPKAVSQYQAAGQRRVLASAKANIGSGGKLAIGFELIPEPDGDHCFVVWDESSTAFDADDIRDQATEQAKAPKKNEAKEYLRDALANGQRPAAEIKAEAEAIGVKERTLKTAKTELGVVSQKVGEQWCWALPDDQECIGQGGKEDQGDPLMESLPPCPLDGNSDEKEEFPAQDDCPLAPLDSKSARGQRIREGVPLKSVAPLAKPDDDMEVIG
jgi:uncharacterized protein YggU (UPF0235/DUF167 family)